MPFLASEVLTLEDGREVHASFAIADQILGIDVDGDLVVPLGEPGRPIYNADGTEALAVLTPCCHATGTASLMADELVCRRCYNDVEPKYGWPAAVAVRVRRT